MEIRFLHIGCFLITAHTMYMFPYEMLHLAMDALHFVSIFTGNIDNDEFCEYFTLFLLFWVGSFLAHLDHHLGTWFTVLYMGPFVTCSFLKERKSQLRAFLDATSENRFLRSMVRIHQSRKSQE